MRKILIYVVGTLVLGLLAYELMFPKLTVTNLGSDGTAKDAISAEEEPSEQEGIPPFLQKQIVQFAALGASDALVVVLEQIALGGAISADALSVVPPEEFSTLYKPVSVTFGSGDEATALTFALGAENPKAIEQMLQAGAPPMGGGGDLPLVAVRYNNRHWNGLERDWSVSLAAMTAYLDAGGDPDFVSPLENRPLFVIARQNANYAVMRLLYERGADVWARAPGARQKPGLLQLINFHHETMQFLIEIAENGEFGNAPEGAIDRVIEFYAGGYLDDDRVAPDPDFAKSGSASRYDDVDKSELVLTLFRLLEPLAPENDTLALVLSFDGAGN